jgi:hypothetical protein
MKKVGRTKTSAGCLKPKCVHPIAALPESEDRPRHQPAAFLVSEDRDFRVLERIAFPKIHVLRKDEFLAMLKAL